MAKKPAKSDRQAVIEQIRKQAEGRRAPPRLRDRRRLRASSRCSSSAPRPSSRSRTGGTSGSSTDQASRTIGAPASACQDGHTKKANGNQDHVPTGHAGRLQGRPAGVRRALTAASRRPDGPQALHRRDRPELETSCTTSSTATRSSGTTRPIADDDERDGPRSAAIADKLEGTSNLRDKFKAVPWTSGTRAARPSPTASTSPSRTGRPAAPGRDRRRKQVGVWQYCSDAQRRGPRVLHAQVPLPGLPEPSAMEPATDQCRAAAQVRSARPSCCRPATTCLTCWARARVVTRSASGVSTTTTSSSPTTATMRPERGTTRPVASTRPHQGVAEDGQALRRPARAALASESKSPTSSQPNDAGTTATRPASAAGSATAWSSAIRGRVGQSSSRRPGRRRWPQAPPRSPGATRPAGRAARPGGPRTSRRSSGRRPPRGRPARPAVEASPRTPARRDAGRPASSSPTWM